MTDLRILGKPNHYIPGAATNHFLGLCDECDAHYLRNQSLEMAETWYRQGMIGQDAWEGYTYAWGTSRPVEERYGLHEMYAQQEPVSARGKAIAEAIRSAS